MADGPPGSLTPADVDRPALEAHRRSGLFDVKPWGLVPPDPPRASIPAAAAGGSGVTPSLVAPAT